MTALVVALAAFAFVGIFWALRLDRMDDYHLMHGPAAGCIECEGK